MNLFDEIAEARIREAMARGEFENLPGSGAPLDLDDNRMIPAELRMSYRILKNAAYLPPELQTRREIQDLEALLGHARSQEAPETVDQCLRRLQALCLKLAHQRRHSAPLWSDPGYSSQLLERFARKTSG